MGIQMGYREREIEHMYFGKWIDLFEEFKKWHNFKMKKGMYEERKVVSMLDL